MAKFLLHSADQGNSLFFHFNLINVDLYYMLTFVLGMVVITNCNKTIIIIIIIISKAFKIW